ncbi:UNVERIFIED_CONTAM: hypothetical protein NCL1_15380 [Trichonephila clavipes]
MLLQGLVRIICPFSALYFAEQISPIHDSLNPNDSAVLLRFTLQQNAPKEVNTSKDSQKLFSMELKLLT